jgi:MoaA/NifB/PqqE/SkfB family radical SAM enzyme
MCLRNVSGGLKNNNLIEADWTFEDFVKILNIEVLNQLRNIYFCGNFGDPIMNNDLIKMCQYVTDNNPSIRIRIHTNGGARNTKWWTELYNSLPKDHSIIFALDGLEDTHHLYRIGTTYDNVIKNAETFINSGGIAEWVFIKFKHNEHQVEEAEIRAKQKNFNVFTVKNSTRFIGEPRFPVKNSEGNIEYYLEPSKSNVVLIDTSTITKFYSNYQSKVIDCQVLKNHEVYIDALRNLYPCCYLASPPYTHKSPENTFSNIRDDILNQYNLMVTSLGGLEQLNCLNHSIKDIVNSSEYQSVWESYWGDNKLFTCARVCGKDIEFTQPIGQYEKR